MATAFVTVMPTQKWPFIHQYFCRFSFYFSLEFCVSIFFCPVVFKYF
uniref:Uncharacterized protein n=1 Tax=Anguilla anguilla TaxID=7936 RepID=A0A0E9P6L7_ANGAN